MKTNYNPGKIAMEKKCCEKEKAMKKNWLQKNVMKKGYSVILFFFFILFGIYSCTDGDPIERDYITTNSIGLRVTLNKIKNDNNIDGRNSSSAACFDFVYPIHLSYNNQTNVTVSSYDGLITLLENENQSLYIEGISFPFKVTSTTNGTQSSISNEQDFQNKIHTCGFTTFNEYIMNGTCYDFVFPFSVVDHSNHTNVIIHQNMMLDLISENNGNYILDIVYPFSVVKNNETVIIHNAYQFFEFNDDCSQPCNCAPVEAPVCVQTSSGILEFQNECIAVCAGFSPSDFVNCN